MRPSGRAPGELRNISLERHYTRHAEGSVLVCFGDTRVICTASVETRVPPWLRGRGRGWVTAEYGMLPRATGERSGREAARGRQGGRTLEIQRLIGRALRGVVDRKALGERTIWLDCDILQADGGTRTASVNAAYVALCDALRRYRFKKPLAKWPILEPIGAISVGIVGDACVADLDYREDHKAHVDMNVVMTASGGFLELQGTGESRPFTQDEHTSLVRCAADAIPQVMEQVRLAMAAPLPA
jgi:ribonuclease PH